MSAAAPASAAATYRRLLDYSARHWPIATLAVLGMAVDAGATAGFTWLIKPMLDDLFVHQDQGTIFWMPIAIVIVFVLRGIATWLTDYGVARVGRGVVHRLREQVFARYLMMPAGYFDREASGQLISRVTYTVEQVAQASTDAVKVMIVDSLTVLGMLFVMLWYGAKLTLALFVMAPLIAALVWFVGQRYRRISRRIQHSVGSVTGIVEEVVGGQREVKVYGGRDYETGRFAEINEQNRRLNLKVASTNALSTALVQIIAACALAAVVFFATRPSMLATMSAGSFMATITAMIAMLPSLKRLTTVQAMMQRGVAAAQDLFAIVDTPSEVDTGTAQMQRSRGEIELRGVSLRYPGAVSDALHAVDLVCPPGKVTALVGRSGSGKTTLASLIRASTNPMPVPCCWTVDGCRNGRSTACAARSHWSASTSCCSTIRSRTTSPTARSAALAASKYSPRPRRPTRWNSSNACPKAWTARSARAARCCPAASASASRSRARSSRTRRY